jgi:hypothetical protein
MNQNRIVYREWIVRLGYDPTGPKPTVAEGGRGYNHDIVMAVTRALEALSEEEADLIRRFYFQGMSYREISRITGREIYRLDGVHGRALRKLKALLQPLVEGRCGREDRLNIDCPLCRHPARQEIERLINSKRKEETWKRIIKILRRNYALPIRSPQLIIGHLMYHCPEAKEADESSKQYRETTV